VSLYANGKSATVM